MEFRPRNVGKGKGKAEPPRNRHHPGFAAPLSATLTASSGSSTQISQSAAASSTSSVPQVDDPDLAAKKQAQLAIKAANAAKRAAETQRQSDRTDAEVIGLLEMSLSDWAIDHGGTGLRMKLKSAESGFISLDWLMRTSKVLEYLPVTHQQPTQVLKALKSCPSDFVELRMSLGGGSTFEIRRKTPLTESRADDLEVLARTVYAENLTPRGSLLPGLLGALIDLLPTTPGRHSVQSVENVHPPASSERPGDKRKAVKLEHVRIVLDSLELSEQLCREWGWHPAALYGQSSDDEKLRAAAEEGDWKARSRREAALVGFRVLSWAEFEQRREEYLAYQKRMVPAAPEPQAPPVRTVETFHPRIAPSEPAQTANRPRARYPEGCLVFVKNVPTDTNKTALKEAFNGLLGDGDAVDYVDWEKGLDTCHVRTSTPAKAARIHNECSSKVIKLASSSSILALVTEVVEGTREEIYWMNLPPKIRESALRARDGIVDEQPASKRRRNG